MMLIDGKFSINRDRGLFKPKMSNINLLYVKTIVEPKLRELAKGRKGENGSDEFTKVYPKMVEGVEIIMPIDDNDNFDLETQKDVVVKILYIKDLRDTIEEYKAQIKSLIIEIERTFTTKDYKIEELFKIVKGKSVYTNKYITENRGYYLLYSSQTTNDGVIGTINTFDYDCNALTWTTDGIYAGTLFLRNGKFSMTTHCGALILKNNLTSISLDYIYSYLKDNLRSFAVGEQNKRITTTTMKNIIVKIPIKTDLSFDIEVQNEIADKYQKIELIKKTF